MNNSTFLHLVDIGTSSMLVKSIPVKVIVWLKNLGLYQEHGDGSTEIHANGIRVNLDPPDEIFPTHSGHLSVTVENETIHIDWAGDIFGTDFSQLSVSRKTLVAAEKNLSEFIEVERMFYDRLDELQKTLADANDPIKNMINAGQIYMRPADV